MNTKAPQHAANTVRQAAVTSSPQTPGRGATAPVARRRPDEEASGKLAEQSAAAMNGQSQAPSADDADFGLQQPDNAATMASEAVDQSAAGLGMDTPSAGAPSAEAGIAGPSDSAAVEQGTPGASSMAGSMAGSGAGSQSFSPLLWMGAPLAAVGAIAAAGGGSSSGGSSGSKPPAGTNPDASGTPGGQPGEPSQAGDPAQSGNPSQPGNPSEPVNPSQPADPATPGEGPAAPDQPPPRLMATPSNGDRPLGIQGQIQLDVRPDCTWQYSTDGGVTWRKGEGASLPSELIGDGQHELRFVQVDAQGRASEPVRVGVAVDLQAPAQPDVEFVQAANKSVYFDHINGGSLIEVFGLEQGADWEYSLDGGTQWIKGEGSQIPVDRVAEGPFHIQVVQIDGAGNRSEIFQRDALKDTIILEPTLTVSGGVEVDGHTVIGATGSISFALNEFNLDWSYRINNDLHWTEGAGKALEASMLAEGANTVEILVRDELTHESRGVTLTIIKDTTAAAPVLSAFGAISNSSFGAVMDESGAVGVTGLESGATWEYTVNGGDWIKGTGTSIPSSAFTRDFNTIQIVQVDAVQNRSEEATIRIVKRGNVSLFAAGEDTGLVIDDNGSFNATLLAAPAQTDAFGVPHANVQVAEAALHTAALDPLLVPPAAAAGAVI